MPVTLYFATLLTVSTIGVLIVNWGMNKETAAPVALLIIVFCLVFFYLLFLFSKCRIVKTDTLNYYMKNMLTRKVEKINATSVIEVKEKGFLDPLTKVITYTDHTGRRRKVWFTKKLGIL